jgi:hypothetical protein
MPGSHPLTDVIIVEGALDGSSEFSASISSLSATASSPSKKRGRTSPNQAISTARQEEKEKGKTAIYSAVHYTKTYLGHLEKDLSHSDYELARDLPDDYNDTELKAIDSLDVLNAKRRRLVKLQDALKEIEEVEQNKRDYKARKLTPKPQRKRKAKSWLPLSKKKPKTQPKKAKKPAPKTPKTPPKVADVSTTTATTSSADLTSAPMTKAQAKQEITKLNIEQREESIKLLQYDRFIRQIQVNLTQMHLYLNSPSAGELKEEELEPLKQTFQSEMNRYEWYHQDYSRCYLQCETNRRTRDGKMIEMRMIVESKAKPKVTKPKALSSSPQHPLLERERNTESSDANTIENEANAMDAEVEVESLVQAVDNGDAKDIDANAMNDEAEMENLLSAGIDDDLTLSTESIEDEDDETTRENCMLRCF